MKRGTFFSDSISSRDIGADIFDWESLLCSYFPVTASNNFSKGTLHYHVGTQINLETQGNKIFYQNHDKFKP